MSIKGYVTVEGTTIHETKMAVLIDFGGKEHKWVPKSCMEDWQDIGDCGEVIINKHFARNENII